MEVREHLCGRPFVPATLAALARAGPDDLIVIGGGGLFMDYFTPFWVGFQPIARRVPFCLWGVGYVDHKREPSGPPQALLEEIVSRSRVCRVRDELTRRRLRSCSLPDPVPCPSFVTLRAGAPKERGILHAANYTTVGAAAYAEMSRAALLFAASTHRRYRETDNGITSGDEHGLAAALERYRVSDLVLSSRLHGCIVALALGRKVLAVSGDWKVEAFMESAGLDEWVMPHDRLARLPRRLAALEGQPAPRAFLAEAVRRNEEVAAEVRAALPRGAEEHVELAGGAPR
jgi:polysaccharide pyruvyl transferase WcaK-like protein